ncbi:hypothetical protein [Nitrincola sp. MINF-07-Sa-05]|uniref:hypothetical protein n=1 Tax=Nitrincola salilacus TaxID=3400273 RepID=UPI00391829B6
MRIDSSTFQLNASHAAYSRLEISERLRAGMVHTDPESGNRRVTTTAEYARQETHESASLLTYNELRQRAGDASQTLPSQALSPQTLNNLEIPPDDNQIQAQLPQQASVEEIEKAEPFRLELSSEDRFRAQLIKSLFESLTGKEMHFALLDEELAASSQVSPPTTSDAKQAATAATAGELGIEYDYQEIFYQQESTEFSAKGQVTTADGKTLEINIDLHMSREFYEHNTLSLRMGAALSDPLILNFDGDAIELSDRRFEFDLTLDGTNDLIPTLASNSAFLALDKNNDGRINDGSELFGARTGNGFAELADYDSDNNGWIDENDPIFSQLLLWMRPGSSEKQQLVALADAGVGAIYLGKATTPFDLNAHGSNELLGKVQATGVFLNEDGHAGTIQHVDLTV